MNVGIRQPYIRVVGIEVDTQGPGRSAVTSSLSPAEEEELRQLTQQPNIYETIAKSVAPSIYGSADIKKAIACLMFGGSRKRYIFSDLYFFKACMHAALYTKGFSSLYFE